MDGFGQESEIVEFKVSTSELKEGIISVVSMLNKHQRCSVYFGIKDDGTVVGQDVGARTLRDVSKSIADHVEPKIFPEITQEVIGGKDCIKVETYGKNIPYYAYGRVYMRVCDEDRKLSAKKIEDMILRRNKDKHRWDSDISDKKIEDINTKVLFNFLRRANNAGRINFNSKNVKTILNKLSLIHGDCLSNAASILFCDNNGLNVQLAVFSGKDKTNFLDIKQFRGNVFELIERCEFYISEHIDWKVEFGKLRREEIPEIPVKAIREALINSFCHRDCNNPKSNEIAIYKDRIEIYNPGEFPEGLTPDDFIRGEERSVQRNPLVAETLYKSKDIERWGSGLKRIYDECKIHNVSVKFNMLKTGYSVVFYRIDNRDIIKDTIRDTIRDTIKILPEHERIIFQEMKKDSKITVEELSRVIGISLRNTKKNIEKLKDKGLVKREGSKKAGYWKVV
ncbi:MAG: putative DNA binding domain-containing protein [Candidatus Aenigmarchaeota archaeon]|nr:putative DNA binding domain-containing protein [Candidatus Aenigmarchaeota archaeon]